MAEKIKVKVETEWFDIPTLYDMRDDEFERHVNDDELFYVDHHEIARSSIAGYPIATTKEQLDIVIAHLESFRDTLRSR
ncbi:hypothetical protein [Planctomicrobium piriforme]|uniref:Uncharacterized protein n=1 Tax=Planctomicrobium piriforme TaxID=1576369 RepID=A0A1I3L362_9PLAN|nr:hypothetical protein [Planctomicrobium piriforme]SFI79163.1 hypothetical protein SAMN05421753_112125 [Planctomicrobium piriforme]